MLETFPEAERLRTGEILRWPGVLAESGVSPEALREAVLACGKQAITDLIDVRAREGAQLATVLIANVTEMEAIVAKHHAARAGTDREASAKDRRAAAGSARHRGAG